MSSGFAKPGGCGGGGGGDDGGGGGGDLVEEFPLVRDDEPTMLVAVTLEVMGDELMVTEDGRCLENEVIDDKISVPFLVTLEVDDELADFDALDETCDPDVLDPDVLEPDDVCAATYAAPRKTATMPRCTCISLRDGRTLQSYLVRPN